MLKLNDFDFLGGYMSSENDPLLLYHDEQFKRIQKAREMDRGNEKWYVSLIQAEIEDRQYRLKHLSQQETKRKKGEL